MTEVTVRIVHDFICPWCFIGQKNMQSVATAWSDKYKVKVEFSPYFLNKNIPRDVGMSAKKYIEEKYPKKDSSSSAGLSKDTKSVLQQMGEDADIFFPKSTEGRKVYHSGRAHLLEKYASERLESSALWALANDIYNAYHIELKNIDSADVLIPIALKYKLSEVEVREAIESETELEKTIKEADRNKDVEVGVPQIYFHRQGKGLVNQISGAQGTRELLKALKVAAEK
mmetsp:Transcript_5831/g.6661  ORF Transcript_5831/g.6661 Transcript_5831/m.6661 type:complete len:228 (+) Transcript_5831:99-782(+)